MASEEAAAAAPIIEDSGEAAAPAPAPAPAPAVEEPLTPNEALKRVIRSVRGCCGRRRARARVHARALVECARGWAGFRVSASRAPLAPPGLHLYPFFPCRRSSSTACAAACTSAPRRFPRPSRMAPSRRAVRAAWRIAAAPRAAPRRAPPCHPPARRLPPPHLPAGARLCLLATECDEPAYVKLVKALCAERGVPLREVASRQELGEMVGLHKTDKEGVSRKVVATSVAVITDYGEASASLSILLADMKEAA